MPLTTRTNGSGGSNIIQASWFNDFNDLLTGAMQDQEVSIKNNLVLESIGPAPSVALSGVVATGTGLGIGAYTYTYTFTSPDGESTESPTASVTTTSGNQQVSLSSITTGPVGTIGRNLYRTAVGGTQRMFLHTLADNTTTTYTDTAADTSLGANAPTSSSFGGALVLKNSSGTATFTIFNNGSFTSGGGGSLGNTTITGTLTVSGTSSLQTTTVTGTLAVSSTSTLHGTNVTGALAVTGTSSLDNANITTNGAGKITAKGLTSSAVVTISAGGLTVNGGGLTVTSGSTSLDGGGITTNGSGTLTVSGLTVSGNITLPNADSYRGKDSGGTAWSMLYQSTAGATALQSGSNNTVEIRDNTGAAYAGFQPGQGAAMATVGSLSIGKIFLNIGAIKDWNTFTGTGSGTYNHGLSGSPAWVCPITDVSGSATQGYDSVTSTQVHVTLGASLGFRALAWR